MNKAVQIPERKYINSTIVLPLIGRYEEVEHVVAKTLEYYEKKLNMYNFELIIITNDNIWNTTPLIQLSKLNENIIFISSDTNEELPGRLFNEALKKATRGFITFAKPGLILKLDVLKKNIRKMNEESIHCLYCEYYHKEKNFPISQISYGLLQSDNLISIDGAIFSKICLDEIKNFDEAECLQLFFEWDLFLRVTKKYDSKYIENDIILANLYTWEEFPFNNFIMSKSLPFIHKNLNLDLNLRWKNEIGHKKINVLVTGGIWESTHNQLCFYNYFETERGKETFSWRAMFDFDVKKEDIVGQDLVIISRGKDQNCIKIMEYCKAYNIPTLYMLDDNWFTVGKDWPEYQNLFAKGSSNFEVFTKCLSQCDSTIVYSKYLSNYVSKYTENLIVNEVNIDLKKFGKKDFSKNKIIGYSGSMRKNKTAFIGLKRFLKLNPDWKLLMFGMEVPEVFADLDSERIIQKKYVDYSRYINESLKVKPSVLLAPLDNTDTSKSKCPNKYLEITAIGAVGVYSDITPYSDYVEDFNTGVLVSEESVDNWFNKIDLIAKNDNLREDIFNNAYQHVEEIFSTENRYEEFERMILNLIG